MRHIISRIFFCIVLFISPQLAWSQDEESFEERSKNMEYLDGYFDLYWDAEKGRLFLKIDRLDEAFLYQSSMARGVGSNDLGLDRGQLGSTKVVEFFRSGPKVLLIENNLDYRATTDNEAELAAVESSFARSVIWGFEVIEQLGDSLIIDATDFFLRDSHGISTRLSRARQGSYSPDLSRSAIYLPRTKAFPDNTEIEAIVTFTGGPQFDANGAVVSSTLASVVPDVNAVTVHLHHSLIRLPDSNYSPLPYDPRAGIIAQPYGSSGFIDYGSEIGEPIRTLYARRHRLEKKNPEAAVSEAIEPIVYYVDPGAPEPVRTALIEGASWWNQAFEAAGYRNAFQVKVLPVDADPMDVRYNVIQWVHRSTRGWSYGGSITDPRTGEILKGHVSLGSLRVRQDYLIAEGLLSPYANAEVPGETDPMLEMSLARIRQLSAHEVGHTIGMEHNFAASVNNRASVMDYPFPLIRFDENGGLDLSDAYAVGMGDWDIRTVIYAYQDFPDSVDDTSERRKIMNETIDSGLLYVSDEDSRNPATAHPQGNLWDNGDDAIEELEHLLKVREYALGNFSAKNIRPGKPLAEIEEVLVPIYLLHRFQLHAVGKLIGGQYFNYNLRGDGQALPRTVAAGKQKQALDALLATLDPRTLELPSSLLDSIPARPPPLAPAASSVNLTLEVLLNGQRAARMNAFHARDSAYPGFASLLSALFEASWYSPRMANTHGAIQQTTNHLVLQGLKSMLANGGNTAQVHAQVLAVITGLEDWISEQTGRRINSDWAAHYQLAKQEISVLLNNPAAVVPARISPPPPGSPIGN
jgi:hypothetical protein